MSLIIIDYLNIAIMLSITTVLSIILFCVSFLITPKYLDLEKTASYECGFEPFSDSRSVLFIGYYLVALFFLVGDIEVALLFPFGIIVGYMHAFGLLIALLFFVIITVGFIYEILRGGLDWTFE